MTLDALKVVIDEAWAIMPLELYRAYTGSMGRRMRAVIREGGKMTKY